MDFRRLGWLLDLAPYAHAPLLDAALGKRALVLDIGGGTGRVARRLSAPRVVVVDRERAMLRRARAKRLDVVLADARALPFRSGSAPGIVMVDACHHVPDHPLLFAECARALAPDGRLVVEEFDPESFGGRWVERVERWLAFGSVFHRPPELLALATSAGLEARIERWTDRDYALVASRPRGKSEPF